MKAPLYIQSLILGMFALGLSVAVHAADITGFTAIEVNGTCSIQQGEGEFKPLVKGETYPFGTVLRTGRNSFVDLQFSEGNTFRLLARTLITVTEDAKNPKLKVMKLETGQVELKLDDYPKDHKLQVETPTAVCGAVGTRFVVTFEGNDKADAAVAKAGNRENRFSCDQGEVYVASRFTYNGKESEGKTLNVGSVTAGSAMTAVIHEGLENTYSDITVNRGKLTFEYGGEKGNAITAEPVDNKPVRFVCALEKSTKDVSTAAIEVKEGEITSRKVTTRLFSAPKIEETPIAVADGPVVVSKSEVFTHDEGVTVVNEYIAAAKVEAEMHSVLVDKEKAGEVVTPEETQALQSAADKATQLRKNLLARNTIRMLKTIRKGVRPPVMPRR